MKRTALAVIGLLGVALGGVAYVALRDERDPLEEVDTDILSPTFGKTGAEIKKIEEHTQNMAEKFSVFKNFKENFDAERNSEVDKVVAKAPNSPTKPAQLPFTPAPKPDPTLGMTPAEKRAYEEKIASYKSMYKSFKF